MKKLRRVEIWRIISEWVHIVVLWLGVEAIVKVVVVVAVCVEAF
jgi:hypothetical protein